jgi:hypothetical protein
MLSNHTLGSKTSNKYYSASGPQSISSHPYQTPNHSVTTHSEKDKDGNEVITETHTYTDTETKVHQLKPGEKIEHKAPQTRRYKTKEGWVEETITYETVEVPQTVTQPKPVNWSKT